MKMMSKPTEQQGMQYRAMEVLESRLMLAADPGSRISTALDLGNLGRAQVVTESLSAADQTDTYRVRVTARGNVNFTLSGLSGDANLTLLNSTGKVIVTAAKTGTANESISRTVRGGVYYVRVNVATRGVATGYSLRLQADNNWGTADGAVGLVQADGSSRAINPKAQTWVVIHGWTSSPLSVSSISTAIRKQWKYNQVLALDWSDPAGQDMFGAFSSVGAVGDWAAAKLMSWGIAGSRINIVGHSMGGYMSDVVAAGINGGANRVIALDPATDPFAFSVNFKAHSQYSVAFIASDFSTTNAAFTADEAFQVNMGDPASIFTHMNLVDFFATVVNRNNSGQPDDISRLFAFDQLTASADRPWRSDGYSGGFEGVIGADRSDGHYAPTSMQYKDTFGRTVTITG